MAQRIRETNTNKFALNFKTQDLSRGTLDKITLLNWLNYCAHQYNRIPWHIHYSASLSRHQQCASIEHETWKKDYGMMTSSTEGPAVILAKAMKDLLPAIDKKETPRPNSIRRGPLTLQFHFFNTALDRVVEVAVAETSPNTGNGNLVCNLSPTKLVILSHFTQQHMSSSSKWNYHFTSPLPGLSSNIIDKWYIPTLRGCLLAHYHNYKILLSDK